jgi:hypothetical protein
MTPRKFLGKLHGHWSSPQKSPKLLPTQLQQASSVSSAKNQKSIFLLPNQIQQRKLLARDQQLELATKAMAGMLIEDANRALAVAATEVGHGLQVLVVVHQLPAAKALTVKTQELMTFFVNDWNQSSSMEVERIVMNLFERRVGKA